MSNRQDLCVVWIWVLRQELIFTSLWLLHCNPQSKIQGVFFRSCSAGSNCKNRASYRDALSLMLQRFIGVNHHWKSPDDRWHMQKTS